MALHAPDSPEMMRLCEELQLRRFTAQWHAPAKYGYRVASAQAIWWDLTRYTPR